MQSRARLAKSHVGVSDSTSRCRKIEKRRTLASESSKTETVELGYLVITLSRHDHESWRLSARPDSTRCWSRNQAYRRHAVWFKKLRRVFLTFPKRLKNLKQNFTRLLYVHIYAKLVANFIRLSLTQICSHDFWLYINLYVCMLYVCMTKLCHINGTTLVSWYQKGTRSSAIAKWPRDASCQ